MKEYVVIKKEGEKWLKPINVPYPNADQYEDGEEPHPAFARADAIIYEELTQPCLYIGKRKVYDIVNENEIIELNQYYVDNKWHDCFNPVFFTAVSRYNGIPTRTVYLDSEHTGIVEEQKVKQVMPLVKVAADIARESEYWRKRSQAAEKLIGMEPSDPKTYKDFCRLHEEWEQIVKQEPK